MMNPTAAERGDLMNAVPDSNHRTFDLESGRRLILVSLTQTTTYRWWSEGTPTSENNDRIVQRLLAGIETEDGDGDGDVPHLIPPGREPLGNGRGEVLPAIFCVGRFDSGREARDPEAMCSSLTIAWFQNDYAFPIAEDVLPLLRKVDWNGLARDWDP